MVLVIFFLFLVGCEDIRKNAKTEKIYQKGRFIYRGNEKILLRGVNISHTAKRTIIPWVKEEDIKRLRDFGLNFIRLTVFWSAVEPERGKYNSDYVESLREIIRWAEKYEIYVLIDMHQDLFGFRASDSDEGDGPPEWARDETCPPFKDLEPWMLNYLDDAVSCNFESFWNNKNGVQDVYIDMFEFVVLKLYEEKAVIGFEIMNEPWPGYSWKNTEEWENRKLRDFYNKVISRVRKHTEKLIFYETHPLSDFGYPFYLEKPEGENLVYAPHIYPLSAFLGANEQTDLVSVFSKHLEHSIKYNVPMIVGEYGVSWKDQKAYEKVKQHIDIFDSNFVGSAIWSYDKTSSYMLGIIDDFGEPVSNFIPVIRPYPELVNGNIIEIKYGENEFTLDFDGDYFILRCPKAVSCFVDSEKIESERYKIEGKRKVKVSWEANWKYLNR